jgi:hypothetical protein
MHTPTPWIYPHDCYYYEWYAALIPTEPSGGDTKARIVDRLRENPHTKIGTLKVNLSSGCHPRRDGFHLLANAWPGTTPGTPKGVVGVSNQIEIADRPD